MKRLALADSQSPEVRYLASLAGDAFGVDGLLRQFFRYVADPVDAEYVRAPTFLVHESIERFEETGVFEFQGDCDDISTLASSILTALGYPNWFTALMFPDEGEYEHVFTRVQLDGGVLEIDPVVPLETLPLVGAVHEMELPVWPT